MIETKILGRYPDKHLIVYQTTLFEKEAEIAIELVKLWGVNQGAPDGEDATGRQKWKQLTPKELVARAFDAASIIMAFSHERRLVHQAPSLLDKDT